jgi:hypothetical protein
MISTSHEIIRKGRGRGTDPRTADRALEYYRLGLDWIRLQAASTEIGRGDFKVSHYP